MTLSIRPSILRERTAWDLAPTSSPMNSTTSYDWGFTSLLLDGAEPPAPMDATTARQIEASPLCRLLTGLPPLPKQG